MRLTVRREELDALQPEWLDLLARQAEPIPFVHPVWQRVWLEAFQGDRELLLLAARDGDTLVGVAPLLREGDRLSLVGHYSICDYMDVVLDPDRPGEVLSAVLDSLLAESWSEFELRGLREASPTLAALPGLCRGANLTIEQETEAVAPHIEPPASWDEYQGSLPKKDRHELRRKLRRLQAQGELELRSYTAREDIEERLPRLLRFMVESRSDKAAFMSEQMGRFFHRMASTLSGEGLIKLYELELDATPVAAILCFDLGGQLYMYNSGYDPEYAQFAVGIASKALCLREAIESGHRCLDFLRGDESYKYDLGGKDRTVYRCLITR